MINPALNLPRGECNQLIVQIVHPQGLRTGGAVVDSDTSTTPTDCWCITTTADALFFQFTSF